MKEENGDANDAVKDEDMSEEEVPIATGSGGGSGPSPKKIKMELSPDEVRRVKVPKRWQLQYELLSKQRDEIITPVDTMGCDENAREEHRADRGRLRPDGTAESEEELEERRRFTTFVSLMLSSQTKDPITADAVYRLQTTLENGLTLPSLRDAPDSVVQSCIGKVSFYRRKTEYLKKMTHILEEQHGGRVPESIDALCAIPGVGPKMAFLQMQSMGQNVGIGVDTHVHRISNRLGWCRTKTPEQTRLALQSWLPKELHSVVNKQMVGFGQTICVPVGPRCDVCRLGAGEGGTRCCPSYRKVDAKSSAKRVPVLYKDGTQDSGSGRLPVSKSEMDSTISKLAQVQREGGTESAAGTDAPDARVMKPRMDW